MASKNSVQATNTLPLNIEDIKAFLNQLEDLIVILKGFGSNVVAHVNSAVVKINSLDSDESTLKEKLSECRKKLSDTQHKASFFKDRVENFFKVADIDDNTIQSIKESLHKNDTTSLEKHLKKLTRYLEKCTGFYDDFQKVYLEAETLCRKTSEECTMKKNEAKNRKYAA